MLTDGARQMVHAAIATLRFKSEWFPADYQGCSFPMHPWFERGGAPPPTCGHIPREESRVVARRAAGLGQSKRRRAFRPAAFEGLGGGGCASSLKPLCQPQKQRPLPCPPMRSMPTMLNAFSALWSLAGRRLFLRPSATIQVRASNHTECLPLGYASGLF